MPLKPFAALLAALALFGGLPRATNAADFTDAAGRRMIVPEQIRRALPAGPSADVLIAVLDPNALIGWSDPHPRDLLPPRLARLPVTGHFSGPVPTAGPETILRLHPDAVIDAGPVTPDRIAFADRIQAQTGIPYLLVDDTIERIPAMLRAMGPLFGQADRGQDLSRYSRHAVETLHGRLLIRSVNQRPRVYFGRGPDGLLAVLPDSPGGEAIDQAGAINVAGVLGRGTELPTSPVQLLTWNPDVIIATDRHFYDSLLHSPSWRSLIAVQDKRVFLAPDDPFGWISDPPGVNRLVGLYWLSGLLYPTDVQDDVRATARDLYEKLYRIKLTDAQLERLVARAGVPKSDALRTPLGGLGILENPGALPTPVPGTIPGGLPGATPGLGPPGRRGGAASPESR
ncbi:MAG TPA: ABC transporter substrate-binding protein [Stellaceae bacterium]|jgi:iron complex transport system substrate-binding protein|nr:ABC transporter substrate-binding protein [Stellaceae bacterium]